MSKDSRNITFLFVLKFSKIEPYIKTLKTDLISLNANHINKRPLDKIPADIFICDGVGKNSLGTSNISGLSFILKVAHTGIGGLFIKRERSGFSHQQETNCIYLHHFCDKIKLEYAVTLVK